MLIFQRSTSKRPIAIRVKRRNRFATPLFLRSLAIALTVHLAGFLLFTIKPFTISHIQTIFPPVQVNIDYVSAAQGAFAELDRDHSHAIAEPKYTEALFPLMPSIAFAHKKAYPTTRPTNSSFMQLQETFEVINLSPHPQYPEAPIIVKATGGLIPLPFEENLARLDLLQGKVPKQYLAIYDVKVEDRTGKIFWHQKKQSIEKTKMAILAEKLLEKLTFAQNPSGFISTGQVEIVLNVADWKKK